MEGSDNKGFLSSLKFPFFCQYMVDACSSCMISLTFVIILCWSPFHPCLDQARPITFRRSSKPAMTWPCCSLLGLFLSYCSLEYLASLGSASVACYAKHNQLSRLCCLCFSPCPLCLQFHFNVITIPCIQGFLCKPPTLVCILLIHEYFKTHSSWNHRIPSFH